MAGDSVATDALTNLQTTSKDGKALVSILKDLFSHFEFKYEGMFDDMKNEFMKVISERNETISQLKGDVSTLKDRIIKLEERIEQNDSYERRDTLVFSGSKLPPPSNSENCVTVVNNLLRDSLQVSLQPNEISVCHRLTSRSNAESPNKRSIIVKFCKRSSKIDILSSARRKKVPNLFVNECLTPSAQTISYVLRKAKRECPDKISGSTTFDGKNFVWVKTPNPTAKDFRHSIATYERLVDFCSRVLEKPVTNFIQEWPH